MGGRTRGRQPAADLNAAEAPAFAKRFVRSIKALPQVRQITLEYIGGVPEICTVIEAPWPDDEYRDPIYRAEGDLLRSDSTLDADFRLVNRTRNRTRDYATKPPKGVLFLLRR